MKLEKKELFFNDFSKTMQPGEYQYLSFYKNAPLTDEFELLFNKAVDNYGNKHFGIYRMCDAEYMYCVGRRFPFNLSLFGKIRFTIKKWLINLGIINQKTGHENKINREFWFGEHYSIAEKKIQKEKFLNDLRKIGAEGYLSPHLVYSKEHFAEEYIQPILNYFDIHKIPFNKGNYLPFYFVYAMLSIEKYKSILFKDKNILVVTAFNERNKPENFESNLAKEHVKNIYFYNISHEKSMLEVIDKSKLPDDVDLVLIGAGIGSANIINQLNHLNALCIDAGHSLDCISRPQLRVERICLLPDSEIKNN